MNHKCRLWKIELLVLWPNDDRQSKIFWGYHVSEGQARDASLRWGALETAGEAIVTIARVDEIS